MTLNYKTFLTCASVALVASFSAAANAEILPGTEWSGNANIGAGLHTGNTDSSALNADVTLRAEQDRHLAEIKADYNFAENEDSVTGNDETITDNKSLGLTHNYLINDQWFWENQARLEQDDIADLDLRTTLATGLGYHAYNRDDLSLKFVFGPGYQHEKYENGTDEDGLVLNWSTDYVQSFDDDSYRLFHNHDFTFGADDFDNYLFQSSTGIGVPITNGIVASFQIDYDYDNQPAPGTEKDDTVYSAKLGYEW